MHGPRERFPLGFYLFFSSALTAHRIVQPHVVPAIVYLIVSLLMLRRLSAGFLSTAAFVAPLAATAQESSSEELGVMSISLADVVRPTIGSQRAATANPLW